MPTLSEHHAPTLHESQPRERENSMPIELSAEKFILAWERGGGSFSEFESAPLSIEMAKSVVS